MENTDILYAIKKYGNIISTEPVDHKRVTKIEWLNLTDEERGLFMNLGFECQKCASCCNTHETSCHYLSENNKCLIYDDRALACELYPVKISGVKIGNAARIFWADGRVELEIGVNDYLSIIFDERCKGWKTGKSLKNLISEVKEIIINSSERRPYLTPPEYSEDTEFEAKHSLKNIREKLK